MHDYRRLEVFGDARSLIKSIYLVTDGFPRSERFGLTQQIRRSAVSVASNVAEGAGRATSADFARFLSISIGSVCELECQLILSSDLGYLQDEDYSRLLLGLRRLLAKLKALRRHYVSSSRPVSSRNPGTGY